MQFLLPSITTHRLTASHWRDKIQEIAPLELPAVALFLTGLDMAERRECLSELRKVRAHHPFTIPFIHAVADMREEEYWPYLDEFGTRAFNLHPVRSFPLAAPLSPALRGLIAIENADFFEPLTRQDLEGFAGICLDISHLEEARRTCPPAFHGTNSLLASSPLMANHISAVVPTAEIRRDGLPAYSRHIASSIGDFQYLMNYDADCFSPLCALELENSLTEQIALLPGIQSIVSTLLSTPQRPRIAA